MSPFGVSSLTKIADSIFDDTAIVCSLKIGVMNRFDFDLVKHPEDTLQFVIIRYLYI